MSGQAPTVLICGDADAVVATQGLRALVAGLRRELPGVTWRWTGVSVDDEHGAVCEVEDLVRSATEQQRRQLGAPTRPHHDDVG